MADTARLQQPTRFAAICYHVHNWRNAPPGDEPERSTPVLISYYATEAEAASAARAALKAEPDYIGFGLRAVTCEWGER